MLTCATVEFMYPFLIHCLVQFQFPELISRHILLYLIPHSDWKKAQIALVRDTFLSAKIPPQITLSVYPYVYPSVMAVGSLESLITISNRFGIQMIDSGLQKLMNVNSH